MINATNQPNKDINIFALFLGENAQHKTTHVYYYVHVFALKSPKGPLEIILYDHTYHTYIYNICNMYVYTYMYVRRIFGIPIY